MEYPFCPFTGAPCSERCALSIGGECAFSNIAGGLTEIAECMQQADKKIPAAVEQNRKGD